MNKTRIEWVRNPDGSPGYSWNPIKGACPVGCWYCYGRKIYQRFKLDPEIRLDLNELMADFPKKPSRIFVCSTFELFHPIADPYRNNIFKHIGLLPDHTFIILTKMPGRIDRAMPKNVWLGVSVTGSNQDDDRIRLLCSGAKAWLKFVSFEPLLEDVACDWNAFADYTTCFSWVIVGRLTGHGKIHNPTKANTGRIVRRCKDAGIPVFLKDNLKAVWGKPLIQEWPEAVEQKRNIFLSFVEEFWPGQKEGTVIARIEVTRPGDHYSSDEIRIACIDSPKYRRFRDCYDFFYVDEAMLKKVRRLAAALGKNEKMQEATQRVAFRMPKKSGNRDKKSGKEEK